MWVVGRDLWGPLFLCLFLAILLSIDETGSATSHKEKDRPAVVFSSMLLMVPNILKKPDLTQCID